MSRIVQVETGRYGYPVRGEFKFLSTPDPDGIVRRKTVVVRLTDDEGTVGYGQAVPSNAWSYENLESVEQTLQHYLAPAVIGADPADLPDIHSRMEKVSRSLLTVGFPVCKAAIDIACHDLVARSRHQSVADYLGGPRRDRLTLSWTVSSPEMAVVEQQIQQGLDQGYRNFNTKVGLPQTLDYDVDMTARVRAACKDGFLWVDANTGYTADNVIEASRRLADAGADVLESPLPPMQISGYQKLRQQSALPVIMDEGIVTAVEAAEFANLGMCDGIALKTARTAGLYHLCHIVQMLKDKNLIILGSGLTDPDIALAATVHAYAWAGIDTPCALNAPQFCQNSLANDSLTLKDDQLYLPEGPGLGIDIPPDIERCLEAI